jgi:hypothetical protein
MSFIEKTIEVRNMKEIIHYCCCSYDRGDHGGVARYDYQISKAFPNRVYFQGPYEKDQMLAYASSCSSPIIITDNHLSCDIPNDFEVIIVHHGVAHTHAEREPQWDPYWKNLCCSGQQRMLFHRDPEKTKVISISKFCTDEFTRFYRQYYTKFERADILHASDLDESRFKNQWNDTPVVLGNWSTENKGSLIVQELASTSTFNFRTLNVQPINSDIDDFNARKQDIYLSADIFLQLSLCEGNSYATLDALLCGLPIVASNVGLFYEDVPEDCFVKVDWKQNGDINYVKEKLEEAWENRNTLSKNCRDWYLQNCGFSDWALKTRNFIGE